jgi:hypothetical protein
MKTYRYLMVLVTLSMAGALSTYAGDITPENAEKAMAAIKSAKSVAFAGRGELLAVGSLLNEESHSRNTVVVLDLIERSSDVKPGMVLVMERLECDNPQGCLIARRVTDVKGGKIETEPYPSIEGLLFTEVKASVIGAVAYAVDLNTNTIRDLRPGHAEPITLEAAVAQEHKLIADAR